MYGKIYRKVVENKIISEVKSQFKPRITTGAIRTVLESIVRFWLHGSELHGVWHFLFFGHYVAMAYGSIREILEQIHTNQNSKPCES